MRIALGVEYDGSGFHGWQRQNGVRTVQACVEEAVSRVADHPVAVICAGRTDTGVHASGQVVHFETEAQRTERSWALGSNVNLSRDVAVTWAKPVHENFHARFSAQAREYRYEILNRAFRPAIDRDRRVWDYRPLDAARMHQAARALRGEHDFSSFRALACQAKSPVRTVHRLDVSREGRCVVIHIRANAFLHHMVRNIAGVLMAIGCGERPVEWAGEVLALRDRTLGGVTAPPQGLYLTRVEYPDRYAIP